MSRYLTVVVFFLLTSPAMAQGPSFNFVELGYNSSEFDVGNGVDVDGDGFAVGGSFEIGENMFVFASYADTDFDFSLDISALQVGLGWHTSISQTADIVARVAYVDAEIGLSGFGSVDESGYGLGIGVRNDVSVLVELYGEISYVDLGDDADNTAFGAGIYFNMTRAFALGLGAAFDDDATSYGVSGRFYFGD